MTTDMFEEVDKSVLRISASDFLSGKVKPQMVGGEGINEEGLLTEDQMILDESIVITYPGSDSQKRYHPDDKWSMDRIFKEVLLEMDHISSGGTCKRPIYSPGKNPKYKRGSKGSKYLVTYVFDYADLSSGRSQLPFFLYLREIKGSDAPHPTRILAHPVQIQLTPDNYLEFDPHHISIEDVMHRCDNCLAEMTIKQPSARLLLELYGVTPSVEQEAFGHVGMYGESYVFLMADLLRKKAILPAKMIRDEKRLTHDIIIKVGKSDHKYEAATSVQSIWESWKDRLSSDTYPSGISRLEGCSQLTTDVFRIRDVMDRRATIGTCKGLVLSDQILIQMEDNTYRWYPRNYPLQDLIIEVSTLYKAASPKTRGLFAVTQDTSQAKREKIFPEKVISVLSELPSAFDKDGLAHINAVWMASNNTMPVWILKGRSKLHVIQKRVDRSIEDSSEHQVTALSLIRKMSKSASVSPAPIIPGSKSLQHTADTIITLNQVDIDTSGPMTITQLKARSTSNPSGITYQLPEKPPTTFDDDEDPPDEDPPSATAPDTEYVKKLPGARNQPRVTTKDKRIHRTMEIKWSGINRGKMMLIREGWGLIKRALYELDKGVELSYKGWSPDWLAHLRTLNDIQDKNDTRIFLPKRSFLIRDHRGHFNQMMVLTDWPGCDHDLALPLRVAKNLAQSFIDKGFSLREHIEVTPRGIRFLWSKKVRYLPKTVNEPHRIFDFEAIMKKVKDRCRTLVPSSVNDLGQLVHATVRDIMKCSGSLIPIIEVPHYILAQKNRIIELIWNAIPPGYEVMVRSSVKIAVPV